MLEMVKSFFLFKNVIFFLCWKMEALRWNLSGHIKGKFKPTKEIHTMNIEGLKLWNHWKSSHDKNLKLLRPEGNSVNVHGTK